MQVGYYKPKRIYVFVNGRKQYKLFNIHPKWRTGWNSILENFSTTLKPWFGAVRVLRTMDGKKIIDNFDDLENDETYVACGLEHFKFIKGGYRTFSRYMLKSKPTEYYPTHILNEEDQKKYPCLVETMKKGRTIIYVFANGKKSPPRKVVLIKSDYDVWDTILIHIANILDIPEGVQGMYTVFGQPLCSPLEIQHGGYYVAIPFGAKFKQIKYLPPQKTKSCKETSPMVTKDVYIAASKTCTSIDNFRRKRRTEKPTQVEQFTDDGHYQEDVKIAQNLRGEDASLKTKFVPCGCACRFFKKKRSKGGIKIRELHIPAPSTNVKIASFVEGLEEQDIEKMEHLIDKTDYFTNHQTQTSAVFVEARYDTGNAMKLNEQNYFLISEEELQLLTAHFWKTAPKQPQTKPLVYEEVKELAEHIVGIIINVSEKIANRYFIDNILGTANRRISEREAISTLGTDKTEPSDSEQVGTESQIIKSALAPKKQRISIRLESEERLKNIAAEEKKFHPLTPIEGIDSDSAALEEEEKSQYHNVPFLRLRRDSLGVPLNREMNALLQKYTLSLKSSSQISSHTASTDEENEIEISSSPKLSRTSSIDEENRTKLLLEMSTQTEFMDEANEIEISSLPKLSRTSSIDEENRTKVLLEMSTQTESMDEANEIEISSSPKLSRTSSIDEENRTKFLLEMSTQTEPVDEANEMKETPLQKVSRPPSLDAENRSKTSLKRSSHTASMDKVNEMKKSSLQELSKTSSIDEENRAISTSEMSTQTESMDEANEMKKSSLQKVSRTTSIDEESITKSSMERSSHIASMDEANEMKKSSLEKVSRTTSIDEESITKSSMERSSLTASMEEANEMKKSSSQKVSRTPSLDESARMKSSLQRSSHTASMDEPNKLKKSSSPNLPKRPSIDEKNKAFMVEVNEKAKSYEKIFGDPSYDFSTKESINHKVHKETNKVYDWNRLDILVDMDLNVLKSSDNMDEMHSNIGSDSQNLKVFKVGKGLQYYEVRKKPQNQPKTEIEGKEKSNNHLPNKAKDDRLKSSPGEETEIDKKEGISEKIEQNDVSDADLSKRFYDGVLSDSSSYSAYEKYSKSKPTSETIYSIKQNRYNHFSESDLGSSSEETLDENEHRTSNEPHEVEETTPDLDVEPNRTGNVQGRENLDEKPSDGGTVEQDNSIVTPSEDDNKRSLFIYLKNLLEAALK